MKIILVILLFPFMAVGQGVLGKSSSVAKPRWSGVPPPGLTQRAFPTPPFNPASVAGMIGWYDVTDAANTVVNGSSLVTNLKDKSGNGHDMNVNHNSSSYPTYHSSGGSNNLPYMTVTNGTDLATAVLTLNQPYVIYYVMKNDAFTDGNFVFSMDNGNSTFINQKLKPAGQTLQMNAGSAYNQQANQGRINQWQLLSMNFVSGNYKFQVNNEPYLQPAFTQAAGGPGNSNGNLLGFQPYYKNSSYSVEEVIVYSGPISVTNDSLIRNYLVNKYANPKNKVLMGFGDSIMYGTNATNVDSSSWMALTAKDSLWNIVNWGYGGTVAVSRPGATGVAGRNGTDLYNLPLLEGVDLSSVYLVFEWGTNDIATDATWVTGYVGMIQAYLNAGIDTNHIYVCTMPARATGGFASLSATYQTTYTNTVAVVNATHVRFYDNITYETSTWNSSYMAVDGIHLSDAGEIAYKNGFEAVLR